MWMRVSTLHASNIKGKMFQFACASRHASCVNWAFRLCSWKRSHQILKIGNSDEKLNVGLMCFVVIIVNAPAERSRNGELTVLFRGSKIPKLYSVSQVSFHSFHEFHWLQLYNPESTGGLMPLPALPGRIIHAFHARNVPSTNWNSCAWASTVVTQCFHFLCIADWHWNIYTQQPEKKSLTWRMSCNCKEKYICWTFCRGFSEALCFLARI